MLGVAQYGIGPCLKEASDIAFRVIIDFEFVCLILVS